MDRTNACSLTTAFARACAHATRRVMGRSGRDDAGSALLIVVGTTAVLFLLSTMLLMTTTYMATAAGAQAVDVKSVDIADAGLNAYLYHLRRDPDYYTTHPTLGPTVQDDGVWFVTASAATATQPITLRAQGRLTSQTTSSTAVATVRFPTFADYAFLYDASPAQIAANTVINGNIRTNGSILNYGTITGSAYAAGSITNHGSISGASYPSTDTVDFSKLDADVQSIQNAATAAGSYYGPLTSPYTGYQVTVSGYTYTVTKVKAPDSSGSFASGSPITVVNNAPIPTCGVLYFGDTTYISGTYNAALTVCCADDAYIIGDLKPNDPQSPATFGLIADDDILIPTWFSSVPANMTLTAALLSRTGAITPDTTRSGMKTSLTFSGSMSGEDEGWMSDSSHGFSQRTYTYDQRLDIYAPPRYPVVHDGSLKVATWVEH